MLVNSAAEKEDHCAKSGELDINSTTFSPSNGQFPSLFNMSTQNSAFHSKDRILNWAILLPHWLKVVDSFFYPRRRRSKYSMTPTVPYTSSGFFPFTKCPNSCISHNYEADTSRNREICIPVLLSGFFDFFPLREIPIGETVFPPPWAWKKGRNSPNVNFHNNKILIECCRAHATNICKCVF